MNFLRKHLLFTVLSFVLLLLPLWILWSNTALTATEFTVQSSTIPAPFSGFRIAQVSDLHNAEFGHGNKKLLTLLENSQPDLIAVTGDLLDSRRTDTDVAVDFIREAVKIAPVYYIPGNHESRIPESYKALKTAVEALGVRVLENESLAFEKDGHFITVTGILDPDFGIAMPELTCESFQLVLSHRPELFDWYVQQTFDLVLTGHAHGGQFRLPFIGGLFAPHQGFFPKYDSGVFEENMTTMVVSRGLGNSLFPLRFNNRPELIIVTLKAA